MTRAFQIVCALFFVAVGAAVIVRMKNTDSSQRPSAGEVEKISSGFSPGQPFKREPGRRIDRGIFFGYSTRSYYDLGVDAVVGIYDAYAKDQGLTEKINLSTSSIYRKVFCLRSVAIDAEVRPITGGATADVGAYWSSVPEDVRYCRNEDAH